MHLRSPTSNLGNLSFKITDIFTLCQLKFYQKLINNKLPNYFYKSTIGTESKH